MIRIYVGPNQKTTLQINCGLLLGCTFGALEGTEFQEPSKHVQLLLPRKLLICSSIFTNARPHWCIASFVFFALLSTDSQTTKAGMVPSTLPPKCYNNIRSTKQYAHITRSLIFCRVTWLHGCNEAPVHVEKIQDIHLEFKNVN